jgi:ornithine cyclodeaminase/mu-crystallin family protein
MIIVPEKEIAGLIGATESFTAVEQVFAAMSRGDAYNFPVIREAIGHADALYGFKSGFDRAGLASGLISEAAISEMGAVINGAHPGRSSEGELTLFDGTGVGLQDLAVASAVVDLALAKGVATVVDF